MDEHFFFSIAFLIFVFLTYKSIKGFILSIIDDRILSIRNRFEEACKIEENTDQKLKYAESRMKEAVKYSKESISLAKKDAEVEMMKVSLEFERKIQSLKQQSYLSMENFKSKKFADIKLEIVDNVIEDTISNLQ